MFHELGHAIHNLLACTKYAIPHSRDFIEIPSIMLENWIWIPEVLVSLSKYHSSVPQDTASDQARETLPIDLAKAVCATRASDRAHTVLSQVQPAVFDLAIHAPRGHQAACDINTTAMWHASRDEVLPYISYDLGQKSGFGQGGFPHLFRKYDAGYFAYPL
jgi:metallopeptidase MepB